MSIARLAPVLGALGSLLAACGGTGEQGVGGGGAGAPKVPALVMVKPMAGVVHVEWTTPAPCDFIDAERKDAQHPTFVHAFEVPGDKTSHMDGDASQNTTYTYRLQCKKGAALSAFSNEMSANPTASP